MHIRVPVLPAFFVALVFGPWSAGAVPSWKSLGGPPRGELEFLHALHQYAIDGNVAADEAALEALDDLPEGRGEIAANVILDHWMRAAPKVLDAVVLERWEDWAPFVRETYLQLGLQAKPEATIHQLFADERLEASRNKMMPGVASQFPEQAAVYLDRAPDPETRSIWAQIIAHAKLEASPETAVEWISAHRDSIDLRQVLRSIAGNPGMADTLFLLWAELPEDQKDVQLQQELAGALSHMNPEHALKWLDGLPEAEKNSLRMRILQRMAADKSPKAAELLQQLPPDRLPPIDTIRTVLMEWGLREPGAAQAWAETIADPGVRENALLRMNTVWGLLDPDLAIKQALSAPAGTLRRGLIRNTALLLAKKDLAAGIAWVDALPEGAGKQEALKSFPHLRDYYDSKEILALAERMKPSPSVTRFVNELFGQVSRSDPEAALEWLATQPEAERTDARVQSLGRSIAAKTPAYAVELVGSEGLPLAVRRSIFGEYIQQNRERPELVAMLFEGLDAQSLPQLVSRQDVQRLATQEPELALNLVDRLPEGERDRARKDVIRAWTNSDPAALLYYLEAHGASPEAIGMKPHSFQVIASKLASEDYEAAVAWVETLEDPAQREKAEYGLVERLAVTAPDLAFVQLEHLRSQENYRDVRARRPLYDKIIDQWGYYDPAAVRAALEGSTIKPKTRDEMLQRLENLKVKP